MQQSFYTNPGAPMPPIDVSTMSVDIFTHVFDEPETLAGYAPRHLVFDELAAGTLSEDEMDRLEVLAASDEDLSVILDAFRPLDASFKADMTDLIIKQLQAAL
jgi:hypothetical protein